MHPSPSKGRWDILLSTYVEAKGFGLTARFSRIWLCLTAEELLFYKDSAFSPLGTIAMLSHNAIAGVEESPRNILQVCTISGDILLRFRSEEEINTWKCEIAAILKPVVCIGTNAFHEQQLQETRNADLVYPFLDHPYSMRNGQDYIIYDEIALRQQTIEPTSRRESLASLPFSDTSTFVAGSSQSGSRQSRHDSLLSGSTWIPDSPQHESLWTSEQLTKSWPDLCDLSDILSQVEDKHQANVRNDDDSRPPSPLVDPDLVFDSGRVYFSVSETPMPREPQHTFLDLTGQIIKVGSYPVASGGYADIWNGRWESDDGSKDVAIKVIRCFCNNDPITDSKIKKRLAQELDIWTKLRHRNIIPLFGVVYDLGRHASMVSPWMHRGSASKYFETLDTYATLHARMKVLCEVVCGLEYLHCFQPPVIHGDLKASNVLIDESGVAVLADFGISAVIGEATGLTSSSFAGSVRWMAFELIRISDDAVPRLSMPSDIWSYGSTVLEIMSNKVPYHHRKNDIQVLHEILLGIKPRKVECISEDIWDLIQMCWRDDPLARPGVSQVRQIIDRIYRKRKRAAVGIIQEVCV